MTVLGNFVLWFALLSAVWSAISYGRPSGNGSRRRSRLLVSVSAAGVGIASSFLLILLLNHDYSVGYVYSYSDNSLPLEFLLSTFYAGQEGSFLFWALCASIIGLMLRKSLRDRPLESSVMSVYMWTVSALLILLVVRSPFRSVWDLFPQAPRTIPPDGRGLNPLLQNFWMVIHPPVLFIGFALMAVPFSIAVAGLWKRAYAALTHLALPWIIAGVGVLGLGIMLGAYWAYGVLGWGGYWGWDPVENSSLIPWLTGAALLHTVLAERRTGKYRKTTFALAMVTFILVIYSTFLTRSGILGDASVHAFADPGAWTYWLLLAMLGAIIVTGVRLLVSRRGDLRASQSDAKFFTRETSLAAGAIVLLLSAGVVLFGTSLPIFSHARADVSFYDTTNLPIAIALLILIGYSLSTQWEAQDVPAMFKRLMSSVAAGLVSAVILFVIGLRDDVTLAVVPCSVFALFVNVQVGLKVAKGDPRYLGGKIAHVGIALFLIGVVVSGRFAEKAQVSLPLNTPKQVLGSSLTYVGYRQLPDGKFGFQVNVDGHGQSYSLMPVMFQNGDEGVMRNPDFASSFVRDVYLSPLGFDEGHESQTGETVTIERGQTVKVGGVNATFVGFEMDSQARAAMTSGGGMAIGSVIELRSGSSTEKIVPVLLNDGKRQETRPSQSKLMGASIALVNMHVSMGGSPSTVTLKVQRHEKTPPSPEVLMVEASVKPFISLVWSGSVLMTIGLVVAFLKRSKET
jgi:cytochrome c-type biogenesis protein CcmF